MEKRHRIGKDIQIRWTIKDGEGAPFDLTGMPVNVYLEQDLNGIQILFEEFSVEGNIISFTYYGKDQKFLGPYTAVLVINQGLEGMNTVDRVSAFRLVAHTNQEFGGDTDSRITTATIDLQSTIDTGLRGAPGHSPYLEDGYWRYYDDSTGQWKTSEFPARGPQGTMPAVTIGQNGNWVINGVDTGRSSVGPKGDATAVTISQNGNWVIDGVDTGMSSVGAPGQNGKSPYIGNDGYWYYWSEQAGEYIKSAEPARGPQGTMPAVTIGQNGNWVINGVDTGRSSVGPKGDATAVTIGQNGNWVMDGVDTGMSSVGAPGQNGKSPYIGNDGYWYYWSEQAGEYVKSDEPARGPQGAMPAVTIGQNGNWVINGVDTGRSSVGPKGDATAVTIGQNGNWFIDGVDTGMSSVGAPGQNGKSPYIGNDGYWYYWSEQAGEYVKSAEPARGPQGAMPAVTIGQNGNWVINGVDTGRSSVGPKGDATAVTIGQNGNWFIDGVDTGMSSVGSPGRDGGISFPTITLNSDGELVIEAIDQESLDMFGVNEDGELYLEI